MPLSEIAFPLLLFSPKTRLNKTLLHKYYRAMKFTKRNIIPLLVFILSFASILRLNKISVTSYSSPIFLPRLQLNTTHHLLAEKEINFLYDIVSRKSPCNILVFGLETQYSAEISTINKGGITVFLEDSPAKIKANNSTSKTNSTRIHRVGYQTVARDAYTHLKHVRRNRKQCYLSATASSKHDVHSTSSRKCKFMSLVTKVPKEVYQVKWDFVIVDGPDGDKPESPGRMAAIYIAGVLARSKNKNKNGSMELMC